MATYSMMREMVKRSEWIEEVNHWIRELASVPTHRVIWTELRDWYDYHPRDAARMYLEAHHLGENS